MSEAEGSSRSSQVLGTHGQSLISFPSESVHGDFTVLECQRDPFETVDSTEPTVLDMSDASNSVIVTQASASDVRGTDVGVGFTMVGPTALDSVDACSQAYSPGLSDRSGHGPAPSLHEGLPLFGDREDDFAWLLDDKTFEPLERETERLGDDPDQHVDLETTGKDFGFNRCSRMLDVQQPKFFWEDDPFLKTVFCKDDGLGFSLKRPEPPIDLTLHEQPDVMRLLKAPRSEPASLCAQVIKHIEVKDESAKRKSMFSNWSSLVCINLEAFSMCDALLVAGSGLSHALIEQSIEACFARKATSTLSKRFYSLNRFVNFCCRNGLQFFPVMEHVAFIYLQTMLNDEKVAASAGRSFLEAVRFASGTLGLRGNLGELGTTRIDGLAVELGKRAGPIKQASPLTVQQVMALERLVVSSSDLKDRAVFGSMLVLLYSCGRFSDGQRAVQLLVDADLSKVDPNSLEASGYVELQVLGSKGARSETLRRTFLPLVAPIFSLSGCDWFRTWIQARDALGLTVQGKLDKPLLCRFNLAGEATPQELTSAECTSLLRRGLRVVGEEAESLRSHSLKTTPLSWSCKFGLDLPTRRLLGHHLDPSSKSPETYGRDSMAPAVRQLEAVLKAVKVGRFRPDESRSGRFINEEAGTEAARGNDADQSGSDSDSTYEPSSSESEDSDEDPFRLPSETSLLWHLSMPDLRPAFVEVPEDVMVFRNVVSGVQHLKMPGNLKFNCGRKESTVRGVALCDHCLNSRGMARPGHE
eukprot:s23_g49.t1